MPSRLAVICSGQAGQHPGMFDLVRQAPELEQLLRTWPLEDVCGHKLEEILSNEELLFSNRIAQPMVVAAILMAWEAVKEILPRPVIVAGYSIGELAAWSVAGALERAETIRVASLRASFLQACVMPDQPHAMLALSLPRSLAQARRTETLLESHGFFTAIEVDEDSVIVGGFRNNAAVLAQEVNRLGGKATSLPIEIASHTPLMRHAVDPFREVLEKCAFDAPAFPVLEGISGGRLHTKPAAMSALSRQLAEPIRWHAVMDSLVEAGVTIAVELGPGAALSKMLKARHPHIECRSVSEFRSLSGLKKWISQHVDE